MQTDLITIVFTDLKGYTHYTTHHSHEDNARLLREVSQIITPMVHSFDGRLVKSVGDGHIIMFRAPSAALECATAIQDYLFSRNRREEGAQPLRLRIAVTLGEVRLKGGDVFGEAVNTAARLEDLTPADEIYLTSAVYWAINRSEYPCEKVGDFHLSALAEPLPIYRLARSASEVVPPASTPPTPQSRDDITLPFGGSNLRTFFRRRLWRRLRWLIFSCLLLGSSLAVYTFYYGPLRSEWQLLSELRFAATQKNPFAILRALEIHGGLGSAADKGEVKSPDLVLAWRSYAVELLLSRGDYKGASEQLDALQATFPHAASVFLLRGLLAAKVSERPEAPMLEEFARAFAQDPLLAERGDVVEAVVRAYSQPQLAHNADNLVASYLKTKAIAPLQRLLLDRSLDQPTRWLIATRITKLGAGDSVDFGALAIDDLKSTLCPQRKAAIVYLLQNNDDRAVGPLLKVAAEEKCAALEAHLAAEALVGFKIPTSKGGGFKRGE